MGTYSYTGTIRFVTVQTTAVYDIAGYGGAGGASSAGNGNPSVGGGKGAEEGGTFVLTAGEKLEIVVGGAGAAATGQANGGGGGGGTFVFANTGAGGAYVPLLVAGGGGGGYRSAGGAGTTGAAGTGNGGAAGARYESGGGGAGVKGGGATGGGGVSEGGGGASAAGGFAGGAGYADNVGSSGKGGFGGGGGGGSGGSIAGGGGGSGYTGGNGGYGAGGQGGTSFDAGTVNAAQTMAGQNAGVGKLVITPNVTCFAGGTAIRVLRDGAQPCVKDVAVEDVAVGDVAVTASGAHRAIRWIGSRAVDCAGFDDPRRARPIRIAAHAFAEGMPARPLRVSPDHALAVTAETGEEILVPAFAFLNGATVVQESVETVTYWHVELDGSHDILLAEGLPAESYLDCGNRSFFAGEDVAMDAGLNAVGSCRRRSNDADALRPTRAALRAQAIALGWRLDDAALGGLRLIADGVPVLPDSDGLAARFLLPATARDVWLVSAASVPWEVCDAADGRRLGLCLAALALGDGLNVQRTIALDDQRLVDGFHPPEPTCRWTDGRARLDPDLWVGCRGHVFLRLALARPCLPAWRAPKPDAADLRVA